MSSSQNDEKIWIFDKKKSSGVWKHIKINAKNKKEVLCIHCETELKYLGSTTSLGYHLRNVHKIDLNAKIPSESEASTSATPKVPGQKTKQTTIPEYIANLEPTAPEVVLAKLAAVDKIPLHTLANSEEIKKGWKARGIKIPNGQKEQTKMLKDFASKLREKVKADLAERKQNGERFSMVCDEWTSLRNKRYMGVELKLNGNRKCYLSLRRIVGKLPAPKVKVMLMKVAKDYGLDFEKDIVGLGSDGAPLMKKSGRLLGAKKGKLIHMICLAHGIHLAVCDILYKKKANEEDEDDDDDQDEDENNAEILERNDESSDDDDEDDDAETEGKITCTSHPCLSPHPLHIS